MHHTMRTFQCALTQDELAMLRRKRPPFFATGERVGIETGDLGLYKGLSRSSLVPRSALLVECDVFRVSDFSDELKKRIGAL